MPLHTKTIKVTRTTKATEEVEELEEEVVETVEGEVIAMLIIEEEVTLEEVLDQWTTKAGMMSSQEEDSTRTRTRTMSKDPGRSYRTSTRWNSKEVTLVSTRTNTKMYIREVTQDPTSGNKIDLKEATLDPTNGLMKNIMVMDMVSQGREKEAQVQEGILIETIVQEEVMMEGEDTMVQEVMEDMVGGVRATIAEETARGPKGMMGPL